MNIHMPKKRTWLVVIAPSIAILLLLAFGGYSVYSWQTYGERLRTSQTSFKQTVDTALHLPTTTAKEQDKKLTELKTVSVNAKKSLLHLCEARPLTGWQTVVGTIKERQQDCQRQASVASGFFTELDTFTGYTDNERRLETYLTLIATQPAQPDEKTWDGVSAAWKKLDADMNALKVAPSFEPTKKIATKVVKAVDDAWQELQAAHVAKDEERFLKAKADLTGTYINLASIKDENDKQLTIRINALQRAYTKTF